MKIKCKDCEAYAVDKTYEHFGWCRRRPPAVNEEGVLFPRIPDYGWCMCGVKKKEPMPVAFSFVEAPNGDVMCVDRMEEAQ